MASTFFPSRLQDSQPPSPEELTLRQNQHTRWIIQREGEAVTAQPTRKTAVSAQQMDTLLERYRSDSLIDLPEDFRVALIARGQFSFIFKIRTDNPWTDRRLPGVTIPAVVIMRVSLPWAPYYGTESEVASMLFASRQGIPVPQVYFFDSSAKNDYGIEFTIQEFVQGEGLDTNQALIPEAVECWHRLWNSSNFTQSGSLYCHWNRQTFFVGPMVDHELFAPRLEKVGHELPQFGPFTSWKGYVEALFNAKWQRDWTKFYQGSQIISSLPDCPVTASTFLARFTGIQAMTRSASSLVFKPRMVHWDMHERNILVQPDGRQIAAVIDWDAVVIEPAGLCRSIGPACVLDYMSSWEQVRAQWNLPAEWWDEEAKVVRASLLYDIRRFYTKTV